MIRTSIRQFRASLSDPADQTTLMRAYRAIARRPAPSVGRVGADWAVWPPAAAAAAADWTPWSAEAHAAGDWVPWGSARAETAAVSAGWVAWPDGAPRSDARPRLANSREGSTPPGPVATA